MKDLPEGWAPAQLEILVSPGAPIRYGILQPGPNTPGGVPYVRPTEISNDMIDMVRLRRTTGQIAAQYTRSSLRRGDVLLSIVGSIGKVAVVPPELEGGNITQSSARLRPRPGVICTEYLAWLLRSPVVRQLFDGAELGTAVHRLNIGDIRRMEVPLAPLAEQKRIVAKVEELLAHVNAARERLARVPAILKRFRQAVLAAACSGRLTEDWREEHKTTVSAAVAPSAGLDEPYKLPATWRWVKAGTLYEEACYGTSVKCERERGNGIPVLRVPNIAAGKLDLSNLKYAPKSAGIPAALFARAGDVLICRTNGSLDLVGKAAVVPRLKEPHSFASYLIRLRPGSTALIPEYLHLVLSAPLGREKIEEKARTTAGQFNLNLEILRGLPLPLAPLPEQAEISRSVERLFSLADAIEGRLATAFQRSDRLTQAVLTGAFRGELVPTEAQLARQEGRDCEPALVLLERIKAERTRQEHEPARGQRVGRTNCLSKGR